MSGQHTPGPWEVRKDTSWQTATVTARTGPLEVRVVADIPRGANWEDDAGLIAAAPDLLAQCVALVELCKVLCLQIGAPDAEIDEAMARPLAAVARATGTVSADAGGRVTA